MTKLGFALCLAALGMLVTGSLPRDKMDKVYAYMGGKAKSDIQPPIRVQLLVGGVILLFFGLLLLGVIRL